MKILCSHESPICLLEESKKYNCFEYALVHLFETHPDYYQFFYNSRHLYNREVLLDCSIFELGHAFESRKYKTWIEKLQPNCYIIPDVLEDSEGTIQQCSEWLYEEGSSGYASTCRKIGVVQGKTFQELVECYKFMVDNVDQIAISFDYNFYKVIGTGKNDLQKFCSGRQTFIQMLIDKNIWDWNMPAHLLGCSLAREFRWYVDNNIFNIRSCDTSNPVMCGIKGIKYDDDFGYKSKPNEKLADLIDIELTSDQKELITYNCNQFKKIIGR